MGSIKTVTKRWIRKVKRLPTQCRDMVVNWRLVHRYPFLKPVNAWTGEPIEHYHYEFTMLDEIPKGWKKAFGKQMCEEIRAYLITQPPLPDDSWYAENSKKKRKTLMDDYYLEQVKEKYNSIRWYSNFITEELDKIERKYEDLSERTCTICGKPATKVTKGYILSFCDECYDKLEYKGKYWTIEEYLGGYEV